MYFWVCPFELRLDCPTACWIPLCGCTIGIQSLQMKNKFTILYPLLYPISINATKSHPSRRPWNFVQASYYLISHPLRGHSRHTSNEMQTKPSRLADSTCKIVLHSTASLRKSTINRCQCRDNADVGKQL